jgi:hypothetical protein
MPDYQKGKIYKLISPSKNLVYYGSTIQTLSQRLGGHIRDKKVVIKTNNKHRSCSSFLVLECGDYKIELVEDYPCNNKQQLEKKEGEYIRNNECVNKNVAGRTDKEYYIDNVDKLKEQGKQYYNNNVDKVKEKHKEYYNDNVVKISERIKKNRENNPEKFKERSKKYYNNNVDKVKEKKKEYYNDNANEIKEKRRQRYLKQKELKDKLKDKL